MLLKSASSEFKKWINGSLYLDFKTFPVAATDIAQPIDEGYSEEKYLKLLDDTYTPYPFDALHRSANSTYIQQVNWCEI